MKPLCYRYLRKEISIMGLRQPGLHNKALFFSIKKGREGRKEGEERKTDYRSGKNERSLVPETLMN